MTMAWGWGEDEIEAGHGDGVEAGWKRDGDVMET